MSEAVTNAVVHADRDQGCGLVPRLDSPGLGLGLPLISQTAAAVEVPGDPVGGTELVMRFNLAA